MRPSIVAGKGASDLEPSRLPLGRRKLFEQTNNGMSTMENQALQIDKKSTEMSRERTAEGKSPKRSPSDRKPLVWQMAVSKKLPSDHPCKGPFPTD